MKILALLTFLLTAMWLPAAANALKQSSLTSRVVRLLPGDALAFIRQLPEGLKTSAIEYFNQSQDPQLVFDFMQSQLDPMLALKFFLSLNDGMKQPSPTTRDDLTLNKKKRDEVEILIKEEVAKKLLSYSDADFKRGVPMSEIAAEFEEYLYEAGYYRDYWSTEKFYIFIYKSLDGDKYAAFKEGGTWRGWHVFTKGDKPAEQIARVLSSWSDADFKQGVPLAEIIARTSYGQKFGGDIEAFQKSYGYLLYGGYNIDLVVVDRNLLQEHLVFSADNRTWHQIKRAVSSFSDDDFKRGVPMSEIAAQLTYTRDMSAYDPIISQFLKMGDREKVYEEAREARDGKKEIVFYLRGYKP